MTKETQPRIAPNWTEGNYSVWVDGVIVGYFKRFSAARKWAVMMAGRPTTKDRAVVQHYGDIINIQPARKEDHNGTSTSL
jgi:hypothetical protein